MNQLQQAAAGRGGDAGGGRAHAAGRNDDAGRACSQARPSARPRCARVLAGLIDDGLDGQYRDYAGAEQATMAIGSVANFMYQRGRLKSASGINAGLRPLHAAVADDERYRPAQFQAALRNFRGARRAVIRTDRATIAWLSRSRSPSSAAARRDFRRRRRAAELGVSHVLLEAERHPADTIYKYQKGKYVMAEPVDPAAALAVLVRGGHARGDPRRVGRGARQAQGQHPPRRAGDAASPGQKGAFTLTRRRAARRSRPKPSCSPSACRATCASSACPGEDLDFVHYQLDDPDAYEDETIVVVGAGDAAIENALALAGQNRVIMINRNEEFARCKEANLQLVLAAIKEGKLECRYQAARRQRRGDGRHALPASSMPRRRRAASPIECDRVIARLGATPPRKLVECFGVKFPNNDPAAVPAALGDLRVERSRPLSSSARSAATRSSSRR